MSSQTENWKSKFRQALTNDESVFINNLTGIRGNRVSTDFVGTIAINSSGKWTKISHLSSLRTFLAKSLVISVFAKKDVQLITKAILDAELGYKHEKTEEQIIYFSLAPLTEEVRMKLVRKCKENLENAKVAARNSRQKILIEVKNSKLPVDREKKFKKEIDEMINIWGLRVTKVYEQKVADLSKP